MAQGVTKNDLASYFGTKARNSEEASSRRALSDQNSRDMLRDHYAKTNQSLVLKIHNLEIELAKSRKLIEELRNENAMLKKRMTECGEVNSPERIEALLEERIKRKMDRLGYISRRTIAFLHKSASTLKDAFEDFGIELMSEATQMLEDDDDQRKRLTDNGKPRLDSISESPPLVTKSQAISEQIGTRESSMALGDGETPTGAQLVRRPRRSELFGRSRDVCVTEFAENFSQVRAETPPCLEEKAEALATPPANSKRPILDTPAVPWMETNTVRRKRTATLKIKTLVEPKLNSKLLVYIKLTWLWVWPIMGNCFSLKHKKKELDQDHPTVSRWLASCDFSSVPDIDDFSSETVEERSPDCVIYDSVLGGDHLEGDFDGYITAVENLESEEGDGSGDTVEELAHSSCDDNQQTPDLYMHLDEESVYETSDEQGPYELEKPSETTQNQQITQEDDVDLEEEDDVVDELAENLVSPRTDLESLVDRKGRVRRSERVQLYLDEKRQLAQRL
ncbi:hypothetical protein OSTOST_04031 [Ostertagia ostertagi]